MISIYLHTIPKPRAELHVMFSWGYVMGCLWIRAQPITLLGRYGWFSLPTTNADNFALPKPQFKNVTTHITNSEENGNSTQMKKYTYMFAFLQNNDLKIKVKPLAKLKRISWVGKTPMQGSFKTMDTNNSLGWGIVQHQIPRRRGSLRESNTTALAVISSLSVTATWMETYHEAHVAS